MMMYLFNIFITCTLLVVFVIVLLLNNSINNLRNSRIKRFAAQYGVEVTEDTLILFLNNESPTFKKIDVLLQQQELPPVTIFFYAPDWLIDLKRRTWSQHNHQVEKIEKDLFGGSSKIVYTNKNNKIYYIEAYEYLSLKKNDTNTNEKMVSEQ